MGEPKFRIAWMINAKIKASVFQGHPIRGDEARAKGDRLTPMRQGYRLPATHPASAS